MMELKDKKILVVGLGKSGLASAMFLREHGAQVTVSDLRSVEALADGVARAARCGSYGGGRRSWPAYLSPSGLDRRQPRRSPRYSRTGAGPRIRHSRHRRIGTCRHVSCEATFSPSPGRTAKPPPPHSAEKSFAPAGQPTQIGGNIGLPVISLVPQSVETGWSVLEVSSFQLETIVEFHPRIAVILNITPDHLDRHGNMRNYVAAKERIFANQTAEDFLVLNAENTETQRMAARAKSRRLLVQHPPSRPAGKFSLSGRRCLASNRTVCRRACSARQRNSAQGRA